MLSLHIIIKIMLKVFLYNTKFCLEIPSAPFNVNITNITSSSATISWTHNEGLGNFTVVCKSCSGAVFPYSTTEKMLTVSNLGSFATYNIAVRFSNLITESIEETVISDYVSFTTLVGGGFLFLFFIFSLA